MERVELTDEILLNVNRPARYIGQEYNMVKKDWDHTRVKVCLCYPDVYEIGMSHLGLKILYHILNERDDVLCERCFTPWLDMEKIMLDKKLSLFSLENKMPLALFDIIGFSLQYELTYTNLLNMLYLAGIPLKSSDRDNGSFPLIIAGGPCAFNPEPLADFIDLFLIGDGEEAIVDIIETYKRSPLRDSPARHGRGTDPDRGTTPVSRKQQLLTEMAKIDGVYVPSFYDVSYSGDKIKAITPRFVDIPEKIKKRTINRLSPQTFPVRPVVPYLSTVHDRITLEIMRGCPNQCRFCQARSIYAPVRMREPDELLDLASQVYKNTGFDELSLVSLSSSSYPYIAGLIKALTEKFATTGVGISLPSLRIEESLKNLPSLISAIKKSGLTFAPEAGTERMLCIINKRVKTNQLFEALRQAYKMGWRRVKLYFMIGLPFEEEDDLEAIVELSDEAAMLRRTVSPHPAEVVINVSSFIPKPHTPLQWAKMADMDELKSKQQFLIKKVAGKRYLKLKLHNIQRSILEGVFSRGDRRLGRVLLDAWVNGARFDAWSESFKPELWDDIFLKNGLNKESYLTERRLDEILPWEHIFCGIDKDVLAAEHKVSL